MPANKACPVLLRHTLELEILAFRHPLAGLQLVKGTVEAGESTAVAAVRELLEEAGIHAEEERFLGLWHSGFGGQVWAFHECRVRAPLAERWSHFTADDGGHHFEFFWQPLASLPSSQWHPLFQAALAFLRERLLGVGDDAWPVLLPQSVLVIATALGFVHRQVGDVQ